MQPSLHIALRQQQTLAPQLRQSLKVLQLPAADLQETVSQLLQENMFLEAEEGFSDPSGVEYHQENNQEYSAIDDPSVNGSWSDLEPRIPRQELSLGAGDTTHTIEQMATEVTTVSAYLSSQIMALHLDSRETACAAAIIGSIDDEGYLTQSSEVIAKFLGIEPRIIEKVLDKIQQSVPAGVGVRNLKERLLAQLQEKIIDPEIMEVSYCIISKYLDLLAQKDFKALKSRLEVCSDVLRQAVSLIQSLNPHPLAGIVDAGVGSVVPEIIIKKQQGQWLLEMNEQIIPRLHVNSIYAGQIKLMADPDEKKKMKQQLDEAEHFIKGVQNRFETLAQVAKIVIEYQVSFLEHGEGMLKPMSLGFVAKKLSVHESTVSRAVSGKYIQTPHGVFELKYFISHAAASQYVQGSNSAGASLSEAAVRMKIQEIIKNDPVDSPYNDEKISEKLLEQGIKLARRTVTKHRKALHIPSSRERKRQYQFNANVSLQTD